VKILALSPSPEAAVSAFPTVPPPFSWKKKQQEKQQKRQIGFVTQNEDSLQTIVDGGVHCMMLHSSAS
jgi:hypothetical protein